MNEKRVCHGMIGTPVFLVLTTVMCSSYFQIRVFSCIFASALVRSFALRGK